MTNAQIEQYLIKTYFGKPYKYRVDTDQWYGIKKLILGNKEDEEMRIIVIYETKHIYDFWLNKKGKTIPEKEIWLLKEQATIEHIREQKINQLL